MRQPDRLVFCARSAPAHAHTNYNKHKVTAGAVRPVQAVNPRLRLTVQPAEGQVPTLARFGQHLPTQI
jgi:hypothetical protein